MEPFVGNFVKTSDGLIGSVSRSGFSSVLQAVNGIAASLAIIAILTLVFNQLLQFRYISIERFLGLFVKLLLIAIIGLKWSNFSAVANAIYGGMDSIAAKLLTMAGPSEQTTVAGAIDDLITTMAEKANQAGSKTGWVAGALLSLLITWQLSLIGCLGALIIIYSKIMFSVYMCIAPMFIACYIFDSSKDYFYRWLQGAITYTLYPVITSAIIGMSYSVIFAYIKTIDGLSIGTIASFIPFISILTMMILLIICIPIIVAGLSGMIQHVSPVHHARVVSNIYSFMNGPAPGTNNMNPQQSQPLASSPMQSKPFTETQPSGSFPGEPARMLAREERLNRKE
ncbi:type IV secretion system protein [Ochrobactrum sp. BTU1]|uniref:type IV secretion system protein n=1 Tax=Ochrobactrum sp. BTU1 TaxID=2840456 RepID=UPI001C04FD0E|nr:type IV secretion system protein [Ochrobactrum sp. BTU1]